MSIELKGIPSKDFMEKAITVERKNFIGYSNVDYTQIIVDAPPSFMTCKEWLAHKKLKQNKYTQFISPGVYIEETDNTFSSKEVESRYAAKQINPNFYGIVNVENLK